jgi:hypothetical protein
MSEDSLVATRLALHQLAERVISPLRVQATGNEIALEARPGGFGTPALPEGGWVGVVGTDVVRADAGGAEHRAPITTLRAAGEHVGLTSAADLPDEPLSVDAAAAVTVAEVHASGDAALRALLEQADMEENASEIHLWPEHFDIAIELGADDVRATYGVSPGDEHHPRPYAYVAPWNAVPEDDVSWNATGFRGAERPVDDVDAILAFWLERRAALRTTAVSRP